MKALRTFLSCWLPDHGRLHGWTRLSAFRIEPAGAMERTAGRRRDRTIPPSIATWWKSFNDPELDSLVERAVRSNLDLAHRRSAGARSPSRSAAWWTPTSGRASMPSGSYARERKSANQPLLGPLLPPGIPLSNDVYQAGFDASWELDVFGGTRRGVEAADAGIAAAVFSRQTPR